MFNIITFESDKKDLKERVKELYFKSINDVQKTEDYMYNQMQINCIKKSLREHTDAPEELVDLLIDAVEEKVTLEYEFANKRIIRYISKKR